MMESIKHKLLKEQIATFVFIVFFWIYWAYLGKKGIFNGVVIGVALWGIYVSITRFSEVIRYFKQSNFIYIFLLIWLPIVISAMVSVEPQESWRVVLNFVRFLFIGALAIYLTHESLATINKWVLILTILVTIDALFEWSTGYHLLGKGIDPNRIRGLFEPGYQMGYYMATISPVVLYQTFKAFKQKNVWRYAWLALSLGTALIIFLAGARAGWITLIASLGLLILWALVQRKISWKAVGATVVLSVVILGAVSQLPTVKNRYANPAYTAKTEIGSYEWLDRLSSKRLVLWEFAWGEFKEHPVFGAGAGSFENQFSSQPAELKNGHDVAYFVHLHGLEVLSETGVVGFIAYLSVIIWLFRVILISKSFPVWSVIAFLAMMPINLHVGLYTSFWALICCTSLILGVRERYLSMQKNPTLIENNIK